MWFGVISLFPSMFTALQYGVTARALKEKRLQVEFSNPRAFTSDKHQSVDDKPYGGGPGMVMMGPPLIDAIRDLQQKAPKPPRVIYLSPQGRIFNQTAAVQFLGKEAVILLAGRYEGIDERIIEHEIDEEWSIGNYILTGGELAAMVMIDTIARLIPGTVRDQDSVTMDSLTSGLLKYPQYTRPIEIDGHLVPEVLLNGHHQQIDDWRLKQSLGKTWLKRPDLLTQKALSPREQTLLAEFIEEFSKKQAGS